MTIQLFCRQQLKRQRRRARLDFKNYSYLHTHSAENFIDRLRLIKRSFDRILVKGLAPDILIEGLRQRYPKAEIFCSSPIVSEASSTLHCHQICFDEENLPFAWNSFDLVLSNLALHWVNDVPGILAQMRYLLKPDGLVLASIFGEQTLQEMKSSFLMAESQLVGGVSPRFAPLIDLATASNLMLRAGFALPVADCDHLTVMYPNLFALIKDLRGMAEGNALYERCKSFSSRALFLAAADAYQTQFQTAERRIPATFDILYLTGWNDREGGFRKKHFPR